MIWDPWSQYPTIYPAYEYEKKLKKFMRIGKKNFLEDFDTDRHILAPMYFLNSKTLNTFRQIYNEKNQFIKHVDNILATFPPLNQIDDKQQIISLMNNAMGTPFDSPPFSK